MQPDKTAPVPTQIVFMPVSTGNTYNKYPELQSKVNGGLQILIGVLAIIFNIVDYSFLPFLRNTSSIVGYGIWCGLMFIVAGSIEISAAIEKSKCKIVASMILSIVASGVSAIFFFMGLISIIAARDNQRFRCRNFDSGHTYDTYKYEEYENCVYLDKIFGTSICMTILAVLEAGISIWASTLGCKVLCCGASEQVAGVLYQTSMGTGGLIPSQSGQFQILSASSQVTTQNQAIQPVQLGVPQSSSAVPREHGTSPAHHSNVGRYQREDSIEKPLILD